MNNQNKKLFEELKKVSVNLGNNIDLIQAFKNSIPVT